MKPRLVLIWFLTVLIAAALSVGLPSCPDLKVLGEGGVELASKCNEQGVQVFEVGVAMLEITRADPQPSKIGLGFISGGGTAKGATITIGVSSSRGREAYHVQLIVPTLDTYRVSFSTIEEGVSKYIGFGLGEATFKILISG